MARRANGEGTICKLPSGKWRVVISVRRGGQLKRISRVCRTKADAVAVRDNLKAQHASGRIAAATGMTLVDYLDQWLRTAVKPSASHNTWLSYRTAIEKHIKPRFPTVKLTALTPLHCQEFIAAMIEDDVGGRAQQAAWQVLKTALEQAVSPFRMIPFNPTDRLKRPVHQKARIQPFEREEMQRILDETKGDHWGAFFAVAFATGMRCGELWGLRWQDVDLNKAVIHVRQQMVEVYGKALASKPKSKASVRDIELPPATVNALRDHRAILMREGLASSELVFPNRSGNPQTRANFHRGTWRPLLKKLGLKERGLHHTRHTFATLLLTAGVPLSVVSKVLGHSSQTITLQSYSHVLSSVESMAADAFQRLLG